MNDAVVVNSSCEWEPFDRVVSRVVFALSKHIDFLIVLSSKPISTEPAIKSEWSQKRPFLK
jgi:hypothetical protein